MALWRLGPTGGKRNSRRTSPGSLSGIRGAAPFVHMVFAPGPPSADGMQEEVKRKLKVAEAVERQRVLRLIPVVRGGPQDG